MANTQSKTKQDNTQSGTSELYKYQSFLDFNSNIQLYKQRLCYIIRHYGKEGIALSITRLKNDQIVAVFGDWSGVALEVDDIHKRWISKKFSHLIQLMKTIQINHAQFFFIINDNMWRLVDVQLNQIKMIGPGMLRDIFGRIFDIQETIKVEPLDDKTIEMINIGTGSYSGNLIIKPSLFKTHNNGPMYAEVIR